MATAMVATETDFIVWGIDQTPYGPVELPALVGWIKDERVTADTWLFVGKNSAWQRAAEVPELQMFFRPKATHSAAAKAPETGAIDARILRRVKILAGMSDEQLQRFAEFMPVERVPQRAVSGRQCERGDPLYRIQEGELRARID